MSGTPIPTRRSSRGQISPLTPRISPASIPAPRSGRKLPLPPSRRRGTIISLSDDVFDGNTSSPDPLALVSPSPVSPLTAMHTADAVDNGVGGHNAVAGPSTTTPAPPPPANTGAAVTNGFTPSTGPGKRVLPARIRRAAGGGAEGTRDLEEMVVDWLERWGEPSASPPDDLPIHLSTLPLSLIDPPTQKSASQPAPPLITLTPNRAPPPSPHRAVVLNKEDRIETPSWRIVGPGEDDREEAKEELEGRGTALSPLKRLRRLPGDEKTEDTSDAYYLNLHKKYEVFERRQRIREKEKLTFERYKMRSRIDLLRNMPSGAWSSIVAVVLSRYHQDGPWAKGRKQVEEAGVDWLRARLVREGKDVLKRYDQLLPVEHKKSRTDMLSFTPTPTPPRQLSSPREITPPLIPARVSALRDNSSQKRSRPSPETKPKPSSTRAERHLSRAKGASGEETTASPRKRKRSSKSQTEGQEAQESHDPEPDDTTPHTPEALGQPESSSPQSSPQPEPFYPPLTISGMPCLLEAATRRESAIEEALSAEVKVQAAASAKQDGKRASRLIAREKTRTSGRLGVVQPFGLPIPPVLEYKSEFTITDEEDFWTIIADREARAVTLRRESLISPLDAQSISTDSGRTMGHVTKEDVMDMREVEAAVVL